MNRMRAAVAASVIVVTTIVGMGSAFAGRSWDAKPNHAATATATVKAIPDGMSWR